MGIAHFRSRVMPHVAIVLSVAMAPSAPGAARAQENREQGWLNLLENKTLAKHWETKGNWVLGDNGVLAFTPGAMDPAGWDYLWSKQPYKDFEAELEFKLDKIYFERGVTVKGAKAIGTAIHGSFLFHVADPKDLKKGIIQVRISDDAGIDMNPALKVSRWSSGGISGISADIDVPPIRKKAAKPAGEWNSMRVLVRDNNITVVVNGEVVNQVLRDHPVVIDRPLSGVIGFAHFGVPIWLRNIHVRELEEHLEIDVKPGAVLNVMRAMSLSADGQRLLTVHTDEIRIWSVASGELERVWPMIPASVGAVVALSPDGTTAAITVRRVVAGGAHGIHLLDLQTGNHRVIDIPKFAGPKQNIIGIDFSADGRRLVWREDPELGDTACAGVCDVPTARLTHVALDRRICGAALSPDGKRLCVATFPDAAHVFDLPPPREGKMALLKAPRFSLEDWPGPGADMTSASIAWAADGSRIVSCEAKGASTLKFRSLAIHFWSADGKRERLADGQAVRITTAPGYKVSSRTSPEMVLVDADRLLLVDSFPIQNAKLLDASLVDLKTGKLARRAARYLYALRASRDGKVMAVLVGPGQTAIFNEQMAREVRRIGQVVPSTYPGWKPDSSAIAWSSAPVTKWDTGLIAGLDLRTLEYLQKDQLGAFQTSSRPKGWELAPSGKEEKSRTLIHDGERIELDGEIFSRWNTNPQHFNHWHVIQDAEGKPRIVGITGVFLFVADAKTGKSLEMLQLQHPFVPDWFSVSPDGRFALVTVPSRRGMFYLYRIDGKLAHLLTIYASGADWVAWTPQGYYAGSPGGERQIGVMKREDSLGPLTFYAIDRFRSKLYRPDIIKLVVKKGNVAEAVKLANAAARITEPREVNIDKLLPPRAVLVLRKQDNATVRLKVQAEASVKEQPITSLRLMMDGRIVPGKETLVEYKDGQPKAEVEWTFELPEGEHLLAVLARSADSSRVSRPILVKHVALKKLPALHVVTVGINKYKDNSLDLQFAAPDAEDLAAAYARHCKEPAGKGHGAFREVKTRILLNEKATAKKIIEELAELGKNKDIEQQDLVVVFFACHGVKHQKEYYLLTHEADMDDLDRTCLSGDALRRTLAGYKCQVLLMLDACQSAGFGKGKKLAKLGLKPATDDAIRDLTDEDCGVAVLCAAMGHEKAEGKDGHGFFTRAVLDVLEKKPGVPSSHRNGRIYVNHMHTYVLDEVRAVSEDRQHPYLRLPWVMEYFVVR
jgi:WD40 repeat protein